MQAKDVMSPGVLSIPPDAPVREAVDLMLSRRISGLPVIDHSGRLVGMLTEGDLLKRVELGTQSKRPKWLEFVLGPGQGSDQYVHSRGRIVGEVMTTPVFTVDDHADLADVVGLMNEHRIRRLPVLRNGSAVGLITRADLLRALQTVLDAPASAPRRSDLEIRSAILAELEGQSWAPIGTVNITVRDGAVELTGSIFDDRERAALRVAAENTPGVASVVDRLVTMEPYTGAVIAPGDAT